MRTRRTRIDPGLQAAIDAVSKLSDISDPLGLTVQTVSQWTRVPVEHVLQIERITGIDRTRIRPDIYPPSEPRRPLRRRPKAELRSLSAA